MDVLVIAACPLPWPRGTPIRVHRISESLTARGHKLVVATYPLGDPDTTTPYEIARVPASGVRVSPLPGPSLRKFGYLDPLLLRQALRLLESRSFDLIYAHHYEGLLVALCARRLRRRLPIVYDSHTLLATELPHYGPRLLHPLSSRLGRSIDLRLPRRADHIIAVAERMKLWFTTAARVPDARVTLIPNGVEHWHFAGAVAPPPDAATGPKIMFAGNLAPYQGVDLLLKIFARVQREVPDARLVLLTESDELSKAAAAAPPNLGTSVVVRETTYAALPSELAAADVLVNPRIDCDGIPQKVLNYMAAGRPIVSFAGSRGILEHGRTALIVCDADVEAFADAILTILRRPEAGQALGRAAREEVTGAYGWDRVAAQVEDALEKCLARAR